MRKRDERFKDQDKYKALPDPLYDKAHPKKGARHYRPKDFDYDPDTGTCNIRHNKRLSRFTLRGQKKVDGQWKLFCLVHNIEKLAHHGYAQAE